MSTSMLKNPKAIFPWVVESKARGMGRCLHSVLRAGRFGDDVSADLLFFSGPIYYVSISTIYGLFVFTIYVFLAVFF